MNQRDFKVIHRVRKHRAACWERRSAPLSGTPSGRRADFVNKRRKMPKSLFSQNLWEPRGRRREILAFSICGLQQKTGSRLQREPLQTLHRVTFGLSPALYRCCLAFQCFATSSATWDGLEPPDWRTREDQLSQDLHGQVQSPAKRDSWHFGRILFIWIRQMWSEFMISFLSILFLVLKRNRKALLLIWT